MAQIINRWTGNAVVDGTNLTTGNVNTAGNSYGAATWARAVSGTPEFTYYGNGLNIVGVTSDIARLDATLPSAVSAVVTQMELTVRATPTTAGTAVISVRNTSGSAAGHVGITQGRQLYLDAPGGYISGSTTPAVAVGDRILIDAVSALADTPTTSNGRLFYRVTNLSNPAWNTTGVFFFDSGYALNLGVLPLNTVWFGKNTVSAPLPTPGIAMERFGVEGAVVNMAHTGQAMLESYFADAPSSAVPLDTPVVTVTATTNPSAPAAPDGSITITWPAVTGADRYLVGIVAGPGATGGFDIRSTNATSPYTFTGVTAGAWTVGVMAVVD